MLNNVKVRLKTVKEAEKILACLFENGHSWRGGSKNAKLSEYKINNLIGIYIEDTGEYDCYQQKAAVTFDTVEESFWSESKLIPITAEQILEYYK